MTKESSAYSWTQTQLFWLEDTPMFWISTIKKKQKNISHTHRQ